MAFDISGNMADADVIRLLIGDTQADAQLLTTEQINFLLTVNPDMYQCAALAADACAALLSRTSGMTADGVHFPDAAAAYRQKAADLRAQAARSGGGSAIYAGGISIADKTGYEEDADRVDPSFTRKTFVPKAGGLVGSTNTNSVQDQTE